MKKMMVRMTKNETTAMPIPRPARAPGVIVRFVNCDMWIGEALDVDNRRVKVVSVYARTVS